MKSNVLLLTTAVLTAVALIGCSQSNGDSSTNMPNTNSKMMETNGMNGLSINDLPHMGTNLPVSTNQ